MTKERLAQLMFQQFAADRSDAIDEAFCSIPWEETPEHHKAIYLRAAEAILSAQCEPTNLAYVVEVKSHSGAWVPCGAADTEENAIGVMDHLKESDSAGVFRVQPYERCSGAIVAQAPPKVDGN